MPFRSRRGNAIRPVHRIKHVIDKQLGLTVGADNSTDLVLTVDAPVLANAEECETGCTVNGIYLKVEVAATSSAALSNFYMYVAKNPGGNLALPNPNLVGISDNKRYIIHQEMVMLQKEPTADSLGGNPRTVFNGVIVIPRGYRRMAPNDSLVLVIRSPGVTADVCIQCHYKEFR